MPKKKKIYKELKLIRKELQAIRGSQESFKLDIQPDKEEISKLFKDVISRFQTSEAKSGNAPKSSL